MVVILPHVPFSGIHADTENAKNKQSLSEYMKACIDALHHESTVDEHVRIAVVQGDVFGGGGGG